MPKIIFLLFLLTATAVQAQTPKSEQLNEKGDTLLNLGRYDDALASYQAAQREAQREKDLTAEAVTLTNQGIVYRLTERNDSALSCYTRALALAERSGDKSELSHVLCSIGILYVNTNRRDEAEKYARRAVKAAHESGDMDMIMYCDYTCGSILVLQGKYGEAIGILRSMAQEAERQQRPNYMLKGYTAIIDYFLKLHTNDASPGMNTLDSINHYMRMGDKVFPKVNVATPEALGYLEEKYLVLRETGHYDKSLDVQKQILALRSKGMVTPLDRIYTIMARNYHDLHKFKDAANSYELALAAKDSINSSSIDKQMSEFSVRFETQQRELEIARLSAQRTRLIMGLSIALIACLLLAVVIMMVRRGARLKSARRYIEGMELERERFARELHDGIAGDLLGLSLNLAHQPTSESAAMLQDIHADIRRVSHELMPPRFEKVSFQECIRDYLLSVNGASFTADNGVRLTPEQSFQLYRIVQETITNIRKYADASYINVSLTQHTLSIENDGYRGELSKGKGSVTIRERAESINAVITIEINEAVCLQRITF